MVLYRVDFLIAKDKVDSSTVKLPKYMVADSFESAVKSARKFESEGITLYECAVQLNDGYISIARGFKGLGVSDGRE
jgi:hypothetical protein